MVFFCFQVDWLWVGWGGVGGGVGGGVVGCYKSRGGKKAVYGITQRN